MTGVADGDEWIRVGEAARLIQPRPVAHNTIRNYVARGLLRARWTATGERLISVASIVALNRVSALPPGAERDAAMARLVERNQGA